MIEIKITLSLDDETKMLVQKLTQSIKLTTNETQEENAADDEQQPSEKQQPALKEPEKPAIKPTVAKSVQKPIAKQEPQTSLTINDIRAEVMNKVNNNREAIKNKLTEMGIKRVTELIVSQYDEFYEFLKNLE